MTHRRAPLLLTIVGKNVKPFLLGLVVLVGWGILVTVTPPFHQLGFAFVPPDGAVSAAVRPQSDREISQYLIDGQMSRFMDLSPPEQAHLADVRTLLGWFLGLALLSTLAVALARPHRVDIEPALIGVLGFGLGTLMVFPVAFERFHQVFFAGGAPWYLPADQFLLTQLYPLGFFAAMWLLVVLLATLTLLAIRKWLVASD